MITLTEALTNRFPQGSAWARKALATMGGGIGPTLPVHQVAVGWMRRDPASDERTPTLFILTEDRIGMGHAPADPADQRWVPISAITSVDVVDESEPPLHALDVGLAGGARLSVAWPETFSEALVCALSEAPVSGFDAAGDRLDPDPGTTLPVELGDGAVLDADPSGLDALGPSPWTEPEVPLGDDVAVDTPTFPVGGTLPAGDPVGDLDAPPMDALAVDAALAPAAPVGPSPSDGATVPDGPPPPWRAPGLVWPDPLRGVGYVGGHPDHPRKRKSGTMVFAPHGLVVSGSGFQSWNLHLEWAEVDRLTIQGADEVMFCDQIKIDPNSSAVCVDTTDGHRLFFEVRMRRPPSLRATLAPLLQMVEALGSWRVAVGLPSGADLPA